MGIGLRILIKLFKKDYRILAKLQNQKMNDLK